MPLDAMEITLQLSAPQCIGGDAARDFLASWLVRFSAQTQTRFSRCSARVQRAWVKTAFMHVGGATQCSGAAVDLSAGIARG